MKEGQPSAAPIPSKKHKAMVGGQCTADSSSHHIAACWPYPPTTRQCAESILLSCSGVLTLPGGTALTTGGGLRQTITRMLQYIEGHLVCEGPVLLGGRRAGLLVAREDTDHVGTGAIWAACPLLPDETREAWGMIGVMTQEEGYGKRAPSHMAQGVSPAHAT